MSLLRGVVVIIARFLIFPSLALAQGGPPLLTDDPDTPGNGRWEMNLALSGEISPSSALYELPYIDVNYGLGSRIQIKLETAWLLRADDGGIGSGLRGALTGLKWRFLDQEASGISVSAYPQFEFRHFVEPGSRALFPIEIKRTFGQLAVDGELGYQVFSNQFNQWLYGVILGYGASYSVELLVEAHGTPKFDFSEEEFLLNTGVRWTLNQGIALLLSIGKTLTEFEGGQTKFLSFVGVRLSI